MTHAPMDMEPQIIKAKLIEAGVANVTIARRLDPPVNPSAITQIIKGNMRSDRVRRAIAEAIGINIREIWPSIFSKGRKMTHSPMDMEPQTIKAKLVEAGVAHVTIARRLDPPVNPSAITHIIKGNMRSDRVQRAIAEAIGIDVSSIWPSIYIIQGGPRKVGRPRAA